jgi:hypothetical protein
MTSSDTIVPFNVYINQSHHPVLVGFAEWIFSVESDSDDSNSNSNYEPDVTHLNRVTTTATRTGGVRLNMQSLEPKTSSTSPQLQGSGSSGGGSSCGCSCCVNDKCADKEECEQAFMIVGIVIGCIAVIVITVWCFFYRRRRRRLREMRNDPTVTVTANGATPQYATMGSVPAGASVHPMQNPNVVYGPQMQPPPPTNAFGSQHAPQPAPQYGQPYYGQPPPPVYGQPPPPAYGQPPPAYGQVPPAYNATVPPAYGAQPHSQTQASGTATQNPYAGPEGIPSDNATTKASGTTAGNTS